MVRLNCGASNSDEMKSKNSRSLRTMLRSRWLMAALLLGAPVALYFVLAARISWRPVELLHYKGASYVVDIAFTQDGKSLATQHFGDVDGNVTLWNLRPWQIEHRLPHRFVERMALAPDSETALLHERGNSTRAAEVLTFLCEGKEK